MSAAVVHEVSELEQSLLASLASKRRLMRQCLLRGPYLSQSLARHWRREARELIRLIRKVRGGAL